MLLVLQLMRHSANENEMALLASEDSLLLVELNIELDSGGALCAKS